VRVKVGWRWRIILFIAAFAVKGAVLASFHDHPLLQPRGTLDTAVYVQLARQVAQGDVALGTAPYFVAPLYIYFLGLVLWISGGSLLAAKILQIILGAIAVVLIAETARLWAGERAAWATGVVAILTGIFTFYEITLLQAALDAFLVALSLFLLVRALLSRRASTFAIAGLAFGVFALNRPNALLAAVGLTILILSTRRWQFLAAFATGLIIAIVPVSLRNLAVSGEPILIASHGGLNFYIGNNATADGTYHLVPGITPSIEGQTRDSRRVAENAAGRHLSAAEVSGYFYDRAWSWIRENPVSALRLFLRKIAYTLNNADLALNHSYVYFSRDERSMLSLLILGPWLLIPAGLLGLAIRLREETDRRAFAIWVSFVPLYIVSVAIFFVSSRYRLPLLVPLCIGSGILTQEIWVTIQARAFRRWAAYLTLLALVILANWNFHLDEGQANERTSMVLYLVSEGRYGEASSLLERIEDEHPQRGLLYYRSGLAFHEQGRLSEAINLYGRALAIDPDQPEIRWSLGQALTQAGRSTEALPHLKIAFEADVLPGSVTRTVAQALAAEPGEMAYEFVRNLRSDSASTQHNLGMALALVGLREEATVALEQAARLDPADPVTQLNLGVLYADAGRDQEARARLRRALELRPGYRQAADLLRLLESKRR
jgi:tetratricopeptide (TPR) repeat protein